jgi:hypothetical protein
LAGFLLAAAFFFAAGLLAATFLAAGLRAAFFAAFFFVAISNLLHKSYRELLPKARAGLPGPFNDPHPRVKLG